MAILSPSILAADQLNLARDMEQLKLSGVQWMHVDVMDGHFVPNMSFGYDVVRAMRKMTDLTLDVHLMIDRPIRYVKQFCEAGADYLTIHIESDTPENIAEALQHISDLGVKTGLSLKPGTSPKTITPFLSMCDIVLVMTVEPGFGGQKFMKPMMAKMCEIRRMLDEVAPSCELGADGGVDLRTAEICKANGANVLVAGSAFFRAPDKKEFRRRVEGEAD